MSSSDVGMMPGPMYSTSDVAGAAKSVPIEPAAVHARVVLDVADGAIEVDTEVPETGLGA